MELTWLADTPQSRSRVRALRACPSCQRRKVCVYQTSKLRRARELINPKKRCRHLAPNSRLVESRAHESSVGRNASTGLLLGPANTTPAGRASPSFSATDRFVGDLNPESVIRERLDESTGTPLRGRIGLWISSAAQGDDSHADQHHDPMVNAAPSILPSQTALVGHSVASLLHQRYVSTMQACERLPAATRHYLTDIYFTKVNDIVPLLDKETFLQAQVEGSASVFLERAICLVAAKHRAAGPHLRLTADGPTVAPRQFCSEIYKGLVAAMDAEIEPDRLTRIRVFALMSLHCEGYEGAEAASMHLCQAIHQSQTIGLHLDRPGRTSTDPPTKLFWCLWTLDKMHACIGGRPVLLADRDIGVEKPNFNDRQSRGAFAVWLAISDLLATVISFYRPSADTSTSGWEEGFPAFEDIVGKNTTQDLDFATLGFLELYYHAVAILSCRHKVSEHLDSSKLSSVRQGLAAVRIHSIVASECADELPPLPLVPYAITLSMGVSYRQLRSSKLITHLDRAKGSLEASCSLLEALSVYWYWAEAMARLGRKALRSCPPEGRDGSSVVPPAPDVSESFEAGLTDLEAPLQGFTDIDTLFGEFFDLSLPTNFWDPIFMEEGSAQDPQ
ncbi:hypothetical protein N7474_007091 [Penicillium riverlandense]|uniref:uncharacterized protein n=1 Tax=Penicillium riverlandense TaxID=1903569 RepID=UPI0025497550|nr:uncharacterized protein N7474_007091 [Penicillium riverlandense]KAJ5815314.1 hypothetical protein N7474_007091 [Penicillium riverlandense]